MTKQVFHTNTLGDKLRQLRDEKNLMQREVGSVIEVDGAFISKVENNEKPINRKHLTTLSKFEYSGQTEPLNPGQTEPVIPGQSGFFVTFGELS
jgi:transcriptional regulator with XRE-family HTH domain